MPSIRCTVVVQCRHQTLAVCPIGPGLMQAYVIATSTLVDISKVDVSKFDDTYFKSTEKKEKKKSEDGFFNAQADEKKELSPEYVENQKKVSLPQ